MAFESMKAWCSLSEEKQASLFETLLADDCSESGMTRDASLEKMTHLWNVMKETASGYDRDLRSQSFLSGGDAEKYRIYKEGGGALIGPFVSSVMYYALSTAESNASMRRIVASPTAGSCGVIPAVLLTYLEEKKAEKARIVEALFIAAGIGQVIAETASISGAEGGCQAEIGSASSMAAGALTYLENGSNQEIANAAALAMKNMLGLTCDPVAGLVEVPCIKRNVSGAVNAIISCQMAMAGIKSAIPVDEVFETMGRIGRLIPACLRETSLEGLAVAPSALKL